MNPGLIVLYYSLRLSYRLGSTVHLHALAIVICYLPQRLGKYFSSFPQKSCLVLVNLIKHILLQLQHAIGLGHSFSQH